MKRWMMSVGLIFLFFRFSYADYPWLTYTANPPSLTNGQMTNARCDSSGNLLVSLSTGTVDLNFSVSPANSFSVSSQVAVSTMTTSPTLLVSANSNAKRTIIVNNTVYGVYISSSTSTMSVSSFIVPPETSFSPDGPINPFQGSVYGVIASTITNQQIGVLQSQ